MGNELNTASRIRQALRLFPDGMAVKDLAEYLKKSVRSVGNSLRGMPDSYIDRWIANDEGIDYSPVWCVVIPPLDCPKPDLITKPRNKTAAQLRKELRNEGRTQPKTTDRKPDRRGHDTLLRRAQGGPNKS